MSVLLAASGCILALGLAGLAAYETYALKTKKVPPITDIVRGNILEHPHRSIYIATSISLLTGWLIGHLGR